MAKPRFVFESMRVSFCRDYGLRGQHRSGLFLHRIFGIGRNGCSPWYHPVANIMLDMRGGILVDEENE